MTTSISRGHTTDQPKLPMTEGRKQFLHYTFVTAMEGGIGYWSIATEYSWSKGGAGAINGWADKNSPQEDLDGFYAHILPATGSGHWFDDFGDDSRLVMTAPEGEIMPIKNVPKGVPLLINRDVVQAGAEILLAKVWDNVWNDRYNQEGDAGKEFRGTDFSREYFKQYLIQYITDMEEGDSDADVADIVIQLGLFGEVIYG